MHRVIIGVEVDQSVIKIQISPIKYIFYHIYHVSQHLAFSCIPRNVNQEDVSQLRRNCIVHALL